MLDKFVASLGQILQNIDNTVLYMVDSGSNIKDTVTFPNYYSDDMPAVYAKMQELEEANDGKTHVFLIFGIEGFLSAFGPDEQRKVKTFFSNTKNHKHIRIIIADSVGKIKTVEYEDFYRNCVQPIFAIWVGSGITDQFTIKSSTYNKETRAQIPNDFGYNVDRGQAKNIKVLDFYTEEL